MVTILLQAQEKFSVRIELEDQRNVTHVSTGFEVKSSRRHEVSWVVKSEFHADLVCCRMKIIDR